MLRTRSGNVIGRLVMLKRKGGNGGMKIVFLKEWEIMLKDVWYDIAKY